MVYTLNSEALCLRVNSMGAELNSVQNKSGFEYIWQADPAVWQRHAPVLFPIVGKLNNNRYTYRQNNYSLTQHGFARDQEFSLVYQNEKELMFELKSGENTKTIYPFDFCLQLGYVLQKSALICSYNVKNTGSNTLLFSIGAHPGFNVEHSQNGAEGPYLEFEKDELLVTQLNAGLLSDTKRRLALPNKRLDVCSELFEKDALVMENNQINALSLCLNMDGRKVEMSCADWPYFGIWSKPSPKNGAINFVCLEPWQGIADAENHNGNLENKKGILHLESGKSFVASFELRFY